jgi:hypothetical protein
MIRAFLMLIFRIVKGNIIDDGFACESTGDRAKRKSMRSSKPWPVRGYGMRVFDISVCLPYIIPVP